MKKDRNKTIRKGLRECLEGELELLEKSSETGKDFVSSHYFDALRIAKRHLPEKEIRKYNELYLKVVHEYWENKDKKESKR